MANNFVQPGDVIPHTASGNIASGAVVKVGALIGVALTDIANGKTGSVALTGAFRVPAAAGLAIGDKLFWDQSLNSNAGQFAKDTGSGYATGDVRDAGLAALSGTTGGAAIVRFSGKPGILGS